MSAIIDFLKGQGGGARRSLNDVLNMTDAEMEAGHDWVQWAFPLPEESKEQPASPVASQSDYDVIEMEPVLKARMLALLGRFILFLDRTQEWRRATDHNHLRITRCLRCLCRCGLNDVAYDFNRYVQAEVGDIVGKTTLWYWSEALKRNPAWLK
jgi:hypothetical protein